MGCDIHAHFEIKIGGSWEHYDQPKLKRNYALFTKMAGVRDVEDVVPISPPKGLPQNASKTTKFCAEQMGADGHSHSWLDAEEIKAVIEWHGKSFPEGTVALFALCDQWGYCFGNGWDDFNRFRGDYPDAVEDIRLVFWFDN